MSISTDSTSTVRRLTITSNAGIGVGCPCPSDLRASVEDAKLIKTQHLAQPAPHRYATLACANNDDGVVGIAAFRTSWPDMADAVRPRCGNHSVYC
jgi:hypothetical protein